jgi:hypothetical protein
MCVEWKKLPKKHLAAGTEVLFTENSFHELPVNTYTL